MSLAAALAQRLWLGLLEDAQPGDRRILVQTARESPWLPWQDLPADVVLWTRSVLVNEILFDPDDAEKRANQTTAEKLAAAAKRRGVEPVGPADSGGRGYHLHVFVDPAGISLAKRQALAAQLYGVDVWKVAREVIFETLAQDAGLTKTERASLDEGKVRWTSRKKGSMVRDFGSLGRLGYAKTLGTADEPTRYPWNVPLWRPGRDIVERIRRAVDREVSKAEARAAKPVGSLTGGSGGLAGVEAHPCVQRCLSQGAPVGERGITALHLVRLCMAEGLTEGESHDVLGRYADACEANGPAMSDDVHATVSRLYDQGDRPRIACPNPMGLSVCSGVTSCPRRRLTLGRG